MTANDGQGRFWIATEEQATEFADAVAASVAAFA
jgi:hypothetical protein